MDEDDSKVTFGLKIINILDLRSGDGANENPGFISDEVDTTYIASEQF